MKIKWDEDFLIKWWLVYKRKYVSVERDES